MRRILVADDDLYVPWASGEHAGGASHSSSTRSASGCLFPFRRGGRSRAPIASLAGAAEGLCRRVVPDSLHRSKPCGWSFPRPSPSHAPGIGQLVCSLQVRAGRRFRNGLLHALLPVPMHPLNSGSPRRACCPMALASVWSAPASKPVGPTPAGQRPIPHGHCRLNIHRAYERRRIIPRRTHRAIQHPVGIVVVHKAARPWGSHRSLRPSRRQRLAEMNHGVGAMRRFPNRWPSASRDFTPSRKFRAWLAYERPVNTALPHAPGGSTLARP